MAAISALILAAGTSSRMGQTKQLLDLGGAPLLKRVIQNVKIFPFTKIIIVIGHDAEKIQNNIAMKDERCRWIFNPKYAYGQSHSLKTGVAAIQTEHVMVFLGDQPFIKDTTILKIYEKGNKCGREMESPFVVRPIYRNIPGHPVFFGNVKQISFNELPQDQGAKTLIKQINNYYELPVTDDGSIFDIDTPQAYEIARQRWESQIKTPKP